MKRAFTMFEVLLVILLLGIIAVVAYPAVSGGRGRQLGESIDRMRALVAMCRAESVNEARKYRVTFEPNGKLTVTRQVDPIDAPDQFETVGHHWASVEFLLDDVWVESVQKLPDGPAPLLVEDDSVEFTELEDDPTALGEIEESPTIDFEPDGTSGSIRWVLRDALGYATMVTLDGRIGRIEIGDVDFIAADELTRPDPSLTSNGNENSSAAQKKDLR